MQGLDMWYVYGAFLVLNRFINEDYQDDDEHGIGSHILAKMVENNITHRAVFLVRYVGEKLENKRYTAYEDIFKEIVQISAFNPLCNRKQEVKDTMINTDTNGQPQAQGNTFAAIAVQKTQNRSYQTGFRGRARGRGGRHRNQQHHHKGTPHHTYKANKFRAEQHKKEESKPYTYIPTKVENLDFTMNKDRTRASPNNKQDKTPIFSFRSPKQKEIKDWSNTQSDVETWSTKSEKMEEEPHNPTDLNQTNINQQCGEATEL